MSTFGVYVGLCLPRSTIAMRDARRPSVWPVASITYHSRWASPASLVSQWVLCVICIGKGDRLQGCESSVKERRQVLSIRSVSGGCGTTFRVHVGFILKPDKTEAGA